MSSRKGKSRRAASYPHDVTPTNSVGFRRDVLAPYRRGGGHAEAAMGRDAVSSVTGAALRPVASPSALVAHGVIHGT
jgi:hypothetical protein